MENKTKLGEVIRKLRKDNGWTIRELLEKLDNIVSGTYITKIENYGEIPSPDVVRKLADAFDVSRMFLLGLACECKVEQYAKLVRYKYRYEI